MVDSFITNFLRSSSNATYVKCLPFYNCICLIIAFVKVLRETIASFASIKTAVKVAILFPLKMITRLLSYLVYFHHQNVDRFKPPSRRSYQPCCLMSMISDPTHFLHAKYELLPSGRRHRMPAVRTQLAMKSFIPSSIKLLNH